MQILRMTRRIVPARHAGYAFWSMAGTVVNMGCSRLVIFPLAAYIIGSEAFGVFVTAYSITMMLGNSPAGGLSMVMLRHISDYSSESGDILHGTALSLDHKVMSLTVGLSVLLVLGAGGLSVIARPVVLCLVPLCLSLYADNQYEIVLTKYRAARMFRAITAWMALRILLIMVASLGGAIVGQATGLAWGYTVGNLAAYLVIHFGLRLRFRYDCNMARVLKKTWLHMTIASVFAFSGIYFGRIVLSIASGYEDVSNYYSVTSIVNLFLMPVSCGSILLMSMLGRYSCVSQLSTLARKQCFLGMLGGLIVVPVVAKLVGPMVLMYLYPKLYHAALPLLSIVIWGIPFSVVYMSLRPFMTKFVPTHVIPLVNIAIALGYIVSAAILVFAYGVEGAAYSFVFGNVVSALAVCVVLCYGRKVESVGDQE